ncbi:retinal guanylyl cyclase 2-like [Patiria miniata]|uniref:Guanylate cyclase n=1 Tax=Patiria miniata TaxID=46514 RepID=A0A913ZJE8_PATMI|nr:retinal guanylyl cyclase 2-like [Patiria miniata]
MTAGSFAFFLVSTLFGVRLDTKDWFRPDRTGLDQLSAAYEAAFVLTVQPGGLGAQYGEGMDRFYKILEEEPFASKVKGHQVSTLFGYVYDSVYLYAIAVGSTWATVKPSPTAVWTAMRNLTFEGISGNVTIDAEGARLFDFVLLDYKRDSQRFGVVRTIERVFDQNDGTASGRYVVQEWTGSEIEWPGGAVLDPDEQCILDGTVCPTSVPDGPVVSTIIAGVGGAVGVCLAISVAIAFFIIVRRRMLKKEMASGLNKVLMTDGDLMFERSPGEFGSLHGIPDGRRTRGSQQTLKERSVHSAHRRESVPLKTEANKQYKVARYNGELVFVKNVRKSSFEMKSSLLRQMKLVRDLRHENVNPFVGCYTEPGDYYWVYEYCTRLSLRDIYSNENLKLDWTFKSSLLVDLVSGMRYLHNSPIKQHGRLTSSNCVIDSRWVLKVTDYGIPAMLSTQSQSEDIEQEPEELLWTAPELLRDPILRRTGTPKGDFYSFAIILSEVLTRAEPFSMLSINPKEIVAKVRKPPPLCRPSVSQNEAPREVIEIMKQCWSEMPDMRLDFVFIYQELKKLNRGRRANIVDSMFKMLEKYSNHLEDLIRERTAELDEEKAKTDMLLNRMLPPSVAAELKAGRTVPPVNYSSVTIFFSDIVGFTNISAQSTAFQVVDFLNDLYTAFDDTLTYHDVYKVETIGDAYMVASGLPITNGNRHAGEIANLALDLLHVAGFEFTIRHMSDKPLRLRIGIHSGQCAAGVVGLAMPRYCLFGDTVNTASRMESNGMAFRIHVSQPTLNILEELGGYHVHLRGDIYLKGKGMARTYWLTGRDGFTKQLPDWKSAVEPEAPTPGIVPDPPSTIVTSTINPNTSEAPPTDSLLQGGLGQRVGSVSSLLTVPDGGCSDIEIEPDDNSSLSNDEGVLSTEAMSTSFYSRTKDFFSNFPGSRPGSGNSLANPSSRPSSRPGSAIDPSSRPTSRVSSRMSNFLNSSRPSSRSPSPAPVGSASPKPRAVHIVITDSDVSTNVTATA